MERIAIVGLGRTGASLGLALKRWINSPRDRNEDQQLTFEIVGFDYDVDVQKSATKAKAVDQAHWSLSDTVAGAGLIVLAVPIRELREAMQDIAPHLSAGAVVTDTTPYKQQTMAWVSDYLPDHVTYVGGHPILTTAEIHEDAPSADLFKGCTYAIFPQAEAEPNSIDIVVGMVQAIEAVPYFPDIVEHDAQIAATSLLPALASVSLMHAVTIGAGWRDLKGFASGDLVDLTRLASTDTDDLRRMIEYSPNDAIRWLDTYTDRLGELRDLIARSDAEAVDQVRKFLEDARKARQQWLYPELEPSRRSGLPSMSANVRRMFLGAWRSRRR